MLAEGARATIVTRVSVKMPCQGKGKHYAIVNKKGKGKLIDRSMKSLNLIRWGADKGS